MSANNRDAQQILPQVVWNTIQIKRGDSVPTKGQLAPYELGYVVTNLENGAINTNNNAGCLYIGGSPKPVIPYQRDGDYYFVKRDNGTEIQVDGINFLIYIENEGTTEEKIFVKNKDNQIVYEEHVEPQGIKVLQAINATNASNAVSAGKLSVPRNIKVDLAQSENGNGTEFDGTQDITLGVKNTLSWSKINQLNRQDVNGESVLVNIFYQDVQKAINNTEIGPLSIKFNHQRTIIQRTEDEEDRWINTAGGSFKNFREAYGDFGLDLQSSDIININGLWFNAGIRGGANADVGQTFGEGIMFVREDYGWDRLYGKNGQLMFETGVVLSEETAYNTTKGRGYEILHKNNYKNFIEQSQLTLKLTPDQHGFLEYGLNCNNSNIININGLYFNDDADATTEGIFFKRTNGKWDILDSLDGVLRYFRNQPNNSKENGYEIFHTGNLPLKIQTGNIDLEFSYDSYTFAQSFQCTPIVFVSKSKDGVYFAKTKNVTTSSFEACVSSSKSDASGSFSYVAIGI